MLMRVTLEPGRQSEEFLEKKLYIQQKRERPLKIINEEIADTDL